MSDAQSAIDLHGCKLWGISWSVGDPAVDDWTSEVILDVDYTTEWVCVGSEPCRFKVAPARIVFSGVTDLRISLSLGDSGFQLSLSDITIWSVEQVGVSDQKVFLDRPYFKWEFELQSPRGGGTLSFGAVGYLLTLLSEPILTDQQRISLGERRRLMSAGVT